MFKESRIQPRAVKSTRQSSFGKGEDLGIE